MPEKHDLLAAILAAKEQGIGQSFQPGLAHLQADIMAALLHKNSNRRKRCAPLSPSSFVTFLISAGLSSISLYNERVYSGYIGTDSIGSLIKRFAAKKLESRRW